MLFIYPANLSPDEDGGFVATFRDIPEAITQGDHEQEALEEAADALEEAIAGRIRIGEEIPEPSPLQPGEYPVALPVDTAAKAALYIAIQQAKLTKVALADLLNCDEKEVRRLLDPHHASKLPRLQAALEALGKKLVLSVEDQEMQAEKSA